MKTVALSLFILFSLLVHSISFGKSEKLDSLLNVLNGSPTNIDTNRVILLIDIAKEYQITDGIKFKKYIDEALEISYKTDFLTGQATGNILYGSFYIRESDYSKAILYCLKGLKIQEKIGNKREMVATLRNIGSINLNSKNFNQALNYYSQALKITEKLEMKREMPGILANLAIVYHQKGNFGKAMEYNLKGLKLAEEVQNKKTISYILNSIGRLYLDMGMKDENGEDFDKAIDYLQQSLKLKEELHDMQGMANTVGNIAEVYMQKGDLSKSLFYFKLGMEYAEETDFKVWQLEAFEKISNLYITKNDYKNAYEYYKKFIQLRDTIESSATKKVLTELQGKYNTEKQDQEIILLSKDSEIREEKITKQNFVIWSGLVGLIIFIGLALFIYKEYKDKERVNKIIAEKNKNITDSIQYAKRIQTAILPKEEIIRKHLSDFFILYKPKDIVSGDFYFFAEAGNKLIVAVADCTGHGVPGAFMSMIGNSLLNQIIKENGINEPAEILNQLHIGVKDSLQQNDLDSHTKDGMDIAICAIDLKNKKLEYAGAQRPLWLVKYSERNQQTVPDLIEIKPNKFPIGGIHHEKDSVFTNHTFSFATSDTIYLTTDGYADQFGGKDGKKFRTKQLKELILSISNDNIDNQKSALHKSISEWMEKSEQIDDILVLGIKL
jgi:serine phosphatase RsbU (regulator of sigma subunit)